jgi:hypothetical protein
MYQLSLKLRRFALILVGCWGFVVWVASPVAAPGAKIRLDPATLDLAPGDVRTLDVRVENVTQLAGAEVRLTFDPALLEVVDADPAAEEIQIAHGDFLRPDFVVRNVADPVVGTVDYAIACMPADGAVSGSGVLARVTFRALAEGETVVAIGGALLADVWSQPIAVEIETGSSGVVIRRPSPSLEVRVLIGLVALAVAAGFIAVMWNAIKARQLARSRERRSDEQTAWDALGTPDRPGLAADHAVFDAYRPRTGPGSDGGD